MTTTEIQPKKAHKPPITSWEVCENDQAGMKYVMPDRTIVDGEDIIFTSPVAAFGGRRQGREVGVQTNYLRNLPSETMAHVSWIGGNVDISEGGRILRKNLDFRREQGENIVIVTLAGGEHVSPSITGGPPPDPERMLEYGKLDPHRDTAEIVLVEFGLDHNLDFDVTCRGFQLFLNRLTKDLPPEHRAIPRDHDQDMHHSKYKISGKTFLRTHPVREVLDQDVRASMRIKPPKIRTVNSAHSQGYKVKDIDTVALNYMAEQGWYPWLVADVPGILEEQQTYESFVRVAPDGNITGIARQYHDERPDAPHRKESRKFSRRAHAASLSAAQR